MEKHVKVSLAGLAREAGIRLLPKVGFHSFKLRMVDDGGLGIKRIS